MQAKANQFVEMKKKIMLKQMKQKVGRQGAKKIQKRSLNGVAPEEIIAKHKYNENTQRLTDRLVPKMKTFGDLECIFKDFEGEIVCKEG